MPITREQLVNRIAQLEQESNKGNIQVAAIGGAILLARELLVSLDAEVTPLTPIAVTQE